MTVRYPLAAALAALIALSGCATAAVPTPAPTEPITPAAAHELRPTDTPTIEPTETTATDQPEPVVSPTSADSTVPPNGAVPADNTAAPAMPGGPLLPGGFQTGLAMVEHIAVTVSTSAPIQVTVDLKGSMPDGCTHLDAINQAFDSASKTFTLTLTTKRPMGMMCTEALVPYEKTVNLPVSGLPAGIYTVKANNQVTTFELASAVSP